MAGNGRVAPRGQTIRSGATAVAACACLAAGLVRADLIVTEIMYNPSSNDSAWEWVEIFNTGTAIDFSTTPHVLDDDDGSALGAANITSGTISSGAYAVLYDAGGASPITAQDFVDAWSPNQPAGVTIQAIGVSTWADLNNTGDRIGLWEFANYDSRNFANAVDEVAYQVSSGGWPNDDGAGSIYLDVPQSSYSTAINDTGSNWTLSGNQTHVWQSTVSGTSNSGLDRGSPGTNPEPSSFVLAGLAISALGLRRWQARRRARRMETGSRS